MSRGGYSFPPCMGYYFIGRQAGGTHPTGMLSCYQRQGKVMFSEASVCWGGLHLEIGGGGRSAVSFVVSTYELLEHEEELFQQSCSTLVIREPTALISKKQQVSLKNHHTFYE